MSFGRLGSSGRGYGKFGSGGSIIQPSYFGVNLSGPEFPTGNAHFVFPTASDFSYLRRLGVKMVRLPIAWENIQTTLSASLDSTFKGLVTTCLTNAGAAGIKVIIDLHNFAHYTAAAQWGSTVNYAGNAGAAGTGVSAFGDGTLTTTVFADVWTKIATEYKGNAALAGYCIMNEPVNIASPTNLIFAPNGFNDTITGQAWGKNNGTVTTQLAAGTNPLGANYSPAWSCTSGTGFGSAKQSITLAAVQYTLSCYAQAQSGTDNLQLQIGATNSGNLALTTSWSRQSLTVTPSAGSTIIQLGAIEASGHTINIANAQLELGGSATTYVPNPYLVYAQAAIDAIRAVDSTVPIYVNGYNAGVAYRWQWENWELLTLTGGNLIFEAHQYFDGSITQGGGGGTYTGNYASYSFADDSAGQQMVQPFADWCTSNGVTGYVGEFGVPNTTADAASWTPLMRKALAALYAGRIKGAYWFYQGSSFQDSGKLNIAPAANSNNPSPHIATVTSFKGA